MEFLKYFIVILFVFINVINCSVVEEKKYFDPNDCYEPGTIFEENEKNLGFCPCKYGYHGPLCFEIHDCIIGELRVENCSREISNDYDLQWRCAATDKEIIKICTCPNGFRGETCEFIMENTIGIYWTTILQSQKFFEVIYNKSDSLLRIIGTKICRFVMQYRRLIMFVIFVFILELAWRFTKNKRKQESQNVNCRLVKTNEKFHSDDSKNSNLYFQLPPAYELESLESADRLKEKKKIEEDSVSRFTQISEISDNVEINDNEPKISRPHLHI